MLLPEISPTCHGKLPFSWRMYKGSWDQALNVNRGEKREQKCCPETGIRMNHFPTQSIELWDRYVFGFDISWYSLVDSPVTPGIIFGIWGDWFTPLTSRVLMLKALTLERTSTLALLRYTYVLTMWRNKRLNIVID